VKRHGEHCECDACSGVPANHGTTRPVRPRPVRHSVGVTEVPADPLRYDVRCLCGLRESYDTEPAARRAARVHCADVVLPRAQFPLEIVRSKGAA
jgi:hypothetical protein